MAAKKSSGPWYWPRIHDLSVAADASNAAFWAAVFVASVTAAFATWSVFSHAAVAGLDPAAYVDALLFALVAWRIRRRSRAFAVIGLCLFVLEKVYQLISQPATGVSGIFLGVVLMAAFVNGVRGTFAWHRLSVQNRLAPDVSAAGDTARADASAGR